MNLLISEVIACWLSWSSYYLHFHLLFHRRESILNSLLAFLCTYPPKKPCLLAEAFASSNLNNRQDACCMPLLFIYFFAIFSPFFLKFWLINRNVFKNCSLRHPPRNIHVIQETNPCLQSFLNRWIICATLKLKSSSLLYF